MLSESKAFSSTTLSLTLMGNTIKCGNISSYLANRGGKFVPTTTNANKFTLSNSLCMPNSLAKFDLVVDFVDVCESHAKVN